MSQKEESRRQYRRVVYHGNELFQLSAREERQFIEINLHDRYQNINRYQNIKNTPSDYLASANHSVTLNDRVSSDDLDSLNSRASDDVNPDSGVLESGDFVNKASNSRALDRKELSNEDLDSKNRESKAQKKIENKKLSRTSQEQISQEQISQKETSFRRSSQEQSSPQKDSCHSAHTVQSASSYQEHPRHIRHRHVKSRQRTPLEEQILNEIPVHWDIFSP